MKKTWIAAGAALALSGAAPARAQQIALSTFVTGLSSVVHVQHDGLGRIYMVQQQGIIRVHDGTALRVTPFLNIDPIVQGGGEEGLLSVAFHPNYAANGFFYVYYTNNSGNNVVARYQRSAADPFVANPGSGFILLTINHPGFGNHNGGSINFGPDGHLYIDTGDGGGGGDPQENAQNLGSLLGKQLRLDVNSGSPYGIPAGNPFVGVPGARPEIWSYGLRNPWRFTFDRQTGDMFIGDVGQGAREEIDFQPAGLGGQNYGWDDMEGSVCFEPPSGCLTANRVLPIIEVLQGSGDCAIVGGFRYRGTQVPFLLGKYLHSDNCSGRIRVATETSPGVWSDSINLDTPHNITTFGEDGNGELYVAAANNGTVYRIVGVPPASLFVQAATVAEGAGAAFVTVTLSPAIAQTVTVQYATTAGTATAGADFTMVSGTLTFNPGVGTRTIVVPIVGDALDEDDETFTVTLSAPTGATIGNGQALWLIQDDDPLPNLDVNDCGVAEGNGAPVVCGFLLKLSPVSGRAVTVNYATSNGTATAGSDYLPLSGLLTIPPGFTMPGVGINVQGDTTIELDETFNLTLANVTNATLTDPVGVGTIVDDDAPSLSTIELTHGSRLVTDLAGGAPDHYRIFEPPLSSWEAILDEVSGDAVPGLLLERLASDNSTVMTSGTASGTGSALSLRWHNMVAAGISSHHLRVRQPACGAACGADDTYRLRLYETTLAASRFNNAGGQASVLIVQNLTRQLVTTRVYFWGTSGSLLHSTTLAVEAQGALTIPIGSIPALAGQTGTLTISHDAPYGGLVGKTVALEPATGFSFDTPLRTRPR
jgi:glucose/arabinose dehydrogenase